MIFMHVILCKCFVVIFNMGRLSLTRDSIVIQWGYWPFDKLGGIKPMMSLLDTLVLPIQILGSKLWGVVFMIKYPRLFHRRLLALGLKWRTVNSFVLTHERESCTVRNEELTYSDSPASMVLGIVQRLSIGPNDVFIDCGSGFGGVCFDLHYLSGAKTIGIDCVPSLVQFSKTLSKRLGLEDLCQFREGNLLESDLSQASIIFITCTCFSDKTRRLFWQQCRQLRAGTYVITVTHPIDLDDFELCESFHTFFEWGRDIIRIYRKS